MDILHTEGIVSASPVSYTWTYYTLKVLSWPHLWVTHGHITHWRYCLGLTWELHMDILHTEGIVSASPVSYTWTYYTLKVLSRPHLWVTHGHITHWRYCLGLTWELHMDILHTEGIVSASPVSYTWTYYTLKVLSRPHLWVTHGHITHWRYCLGLTWELHMDILHTEGIVSASPESYTWTYYTLKVLSRPHLWVTHGHITHWRYCLGLTSELHMDILHTEGIVSASPESYTWTYYTLEVLSRPHLWVTHGHITHWRYCLGFTCELHMEILHTEGIVSASPVSYTWTYYTLKVLSRPHLWVTHGHITHWRYCLGLTWELHMDILHTEGIVSASPVSYTWTYYTLKVLSRPHLWVTHGDITHWRYCLGFTCELHMDILHTEGIVSASPESYTWTYYTRKVLSRLHLWVTHGHITHWRYCLGLTWELHMDILHTEGIVSASPVSYTWTYYTLKVLSRLHLWVTHGHITHWRYCLGLTCELHMDILHTEGIVLASPVSYTWTYYTLKVLSRPHLWVTHGHITHWRYCLGFTCELHMDILHTEGIVSASPVSYTWAYYTLKVLSRPHLWVTHGHITHWRYCLGFTCELHMDILHTEGIVSASPVSYTWTYYTLKVLSRLHLWVTHGHITHWRYCIGLTWELHMDILHTEGIVSASPVSYTWRYYTLKVLSRLHLWVTHGHITHWRYRTQDT